MFKVDVHVHTSYSKDALCSPKNIIRFGLKKGLNAVAITDHNTTKAWPKAKEISKKLDFPIIFGEEVKILDNGKIGEILCLFIQEEIKPGPLDEVLEEVKDQDGITILAHPFDVCGRGFKKPELVANRVNGVEVLNGRSLFSYSKKKALEFAKVHNLSIMGGSDAHCCWEIGNAFTIADVHDLEGFRKAVLKGKTNFLGKRSSIMYRGVSVLARIVHI